MHHDLGLLSLSLIKDVGRLDRERDRVPGSLRETERAVVCAGKVRGARGAEESAKFVLELLVDIIEESAK
jgi:hypothetical protein